MPTLHNRRTVIGFPAAQRDNILFVYLTFLYRQQHTIHLPPDSGNAGQIFQFKHKFTRGIKKSGTPPMRRLAWNVILWIPGPRWALMIFQKIVFQKVSLENMVYFETWVRIKFVLNYNLENNHKQYTYERQCTNF